MTLLFLHEMRTQNRVHCAHCAHIQIQVQEEFTVNRTLWNDIIRIVTDVPFSLTVCIILLRRPFILRNVFGYFVPFNVRRMNVLTARPSSNVLSLISAFFFLHWNHLKMSKWYGKKKATMRRAAWCKQPFFPFKFHFVGHIHIESKHSVKVVRAASNGMHCVWTIWGIIVATSNVWLSKQRKVFAV